MSIIDDISKSLETHFATQWAGRTPIGYENIDDPATAGQSWVDLIIDIAGAPQVGLPGRFRYAGVFQVDIYVPKGVGTKPANDYADIIIPWYNGQQVDGITLKNLTVYKDRNSYPLWLKLSLKWELYKDNVGS